MANECEHYSTVTSKHLLRTVICKAYITRRTHLGLSGIDSDTFKDPDSFQGLSRSGKNKKKFPVFQSHWESCGHLALLEVSTFHASVFFTAKAEYYYHIISRFGLRAINKDTCLR